MKTNTLFITIKTCLISLTALIILNVPAIANKNSDTVRFMLIADPHFCNLAGYHPVIVNSRQHYGDIAEPLLEFLNTLPKRTRADFVVMAGDMIDFYEGETASGPMLNTQVEQFAGLLAKANIPVYLALGNHDIASYMVDPRSGRNTSKQFQAGAARASWIRNIPCFRDGTYYSQTFRIDTTTYRLIFLDNAYYSSGIGEKTENPYLIDKSQLLWLDDQLKKCDHDIEIIIMHMPLFNMNPEELAATRNTYHLDLEKTGAIYHRLQLPDEYLFDLQSILDQNSSVRLILSGHRHSSVIHDVRFSDEYSLTHAMIGAFGRDTRNWRLIQLTAGSIIISFPGNTRQQYVINLNP